MRQARSHLMSPKSGRAGLPDRMTSRLVIPLICHAIPHSRLIAMCHVAVYRTEVTERFCLQTAWTVRSAADTVKMFCCLSASCSDAPVSPVSTRVRLSSSVSFLGLVLHLHLTIFYSVVSSVFRIVRSMTNTNTVRKEW
jgi:hypothetical protein